MARQACCPVVICFMPSAASRPRHAPCPWRLVHCPPPPFPALLPRPSIRAVGTCVPVCLRCADCRHRDRRVARRRARRHRRADVRAHAAEAADARVQHAAGVHADGGNPRQMQPDAPGCNRMRLDATGCNMRQRVRLPRRVQTAHATGNGHCVRRAVQNVKRAKLCNLQRALCIIKHATCNM